MSPGIFITGTGTDVGKTLVTAGVLRWFLAQGVNAMVMKPVQTGATPSPAPASTPAGGVSGREDAPLIAPDFEFVLRAARLDVDEETLAHLSTYVFLPACSPHLAARMAGTCIQIANILDGVRWLAARHQLILVEGAGGLMAPLNSRETMLDLAAALAMPVLLVGNSGLGAINHVLLSLDTLRQRSLRVLGVVLNDTQPVSKADGYIRDDNVRTIESFGRVRVLARIPYLGEPPDLQALDAALSPCDFQQELRA